MTVVAHSDPKGYADQWHVFNDFYVKPVSAEEALTFNPTWKMPSVIAYQVKSANNCIDTEWKKDLDAGLLYSYPT